jgi:hypothetical protein
VGRLTDLVQLFGAVAGADRYPAEVFEHGQCRIDHARARAVGAGHPILDLFYKFVSVPWLFGNQRQNEKAQIAMRKQPVEVLPASRPTFPATAPVES